MALPSTGAISLSAVNTELAKAAGAAISLNDAAVRTLAGKASGIISLADLWGKSSVVNGTLVAGNIFDNINLQFQGYAASNSSISSNRAMGSLTDLPGAPARPLFMGLMIEEGYPTLQLEWAGDVLASLAGKRPFVNNVGVTLSAPYVYSGRTYWVGDFGTPLNNGTAYAVRIG
jgi:hypothetical protein